MNERELKDVLRDAMRERQTEPPPAFDAVWAAAEARHRRSRRRTAMLGSAAAAAVVTTVVVLWPGEPPPGDDEYRIAWALEHSTAWQAPSDALLPDYRDDIYGEIPALMESTELNTEYDEGSLL